MVDVSTLQYSKPSLHIHSEKIPSHSEKFPSRPGLWLRLEFRVKYQLQFNHTVEATIYKVYVKVYVALQTAFLRSSDSRGNGPARVSVCSSPRAGCGQPLARRKQFQQLERVAMTGVKPMKCFHCQPLLLLKKLFILRRMGKNKAQAPTLPRIRYMSRVNLTRRSRCNSSSLR